MLRTRRRWRAPKVTGALFTLSLYCENSRLEGLRALYSLARIGHQCNRMLKAREASTHHRKATVVVVISEETRLAAPHGIEIACLQPLFIHWFYIEVGVGNKAACILPVLGIENFRNRVRGTAPHQGLQRSVK